MNGRSAQTVHSLSGGERSFSTISFLLAMWQSLDTPFYALDEFDVFMDQVNRKKSIEMLIEVAEHLSTSQFILITPQSLS